MSLSQRALGSLGDITPFTELNLSPHLGSNFLGQLSTPYLQALILFIHLFSKFQHIGARMLTS